MEYSRGSGLLYEYRQEVELVRLVPMSGPAAGGTTVSIVGHGFDARTSYRCIFGQQGTSAAAVLASPSTVVCKTPARMQAAQGASGAVEVRITSTSGGSVSTTALLFTYVPRIEVYKLVPSAGSVLGGSLLTVMGSGFAGDTLDIMFGHALVTAWEVSLAATKPASGRSKEDPAHRYS